MVGADKKPPLAPGREARQLFNLIMVRCHSTRLPGDRRTVTPVVGVAVDELFATRAAAGLDDSPLVVELARARWLGRRGGVVVAMP